MELNTRTQSDLVKMLVSGAKKRGAALQTDQARYLISVVGTDMQTLLHELDKLSAFARTARSRRRLLTIWPPSACKRVYTTCPNSL